MLAQPVAEDVFPRPFGRYRLLAPLAQGGMGSLFLGCQGDSGLEKLCVVKTVLPQLADKEYVARFRDEAKVVVQLSHGNLVPVFDAGVVGGELYIAMDFVDGKDLRAVWNRCAKKGIAFPVDVAVHIVRELARGLHHAHTAGDLHLVHRDVSPPNVLLAFSGEVKLTDFGLAASTLKLEKTAPGVIYGKVSYMSPEQARGDALDGRTDQYAAAIILWELLTGRQLFPAADPDVLLTVRNPRVDAPSRRAARVPARLDAIVMKALAPRQGDRFRDCEAFRAALAEFLAREAPATDAARVASFLRELFAEEIEEERKKRVELVEHSRRSAGLAGPLSPEERRKGMRAVAAADGDGAPVSELTGTSTSGVVGSQLGGRYKVVRVIGEGGMGRVYEAEHIDIGKRVAIKLLHPAYTRAPELVERFRREARAASRIGHPNIVDVTDSGTTSDGSVFFVMEFLEGSDLAQLLEEETRLGVERAVPIAIQLARALEAAHAAGIIHRDLKPENVFLINRPGQKDFVKVLDFGIARQIDIEGVREGRLTDPGMAMGTPEYMAPEQASGRAIDGRADIYSVGALLFEMLSGRPPHEGKNLMELLHKKTSSPPPLLSAIRGEVSEELSQLVAKALAPEAAARHQTMEELARALERCRPDRRSRNRAPADAEPAPAATPATPTSEESLRERSKRAQAPTRKRFLPLPFTRYRVPALVGLAALLVLAPLLLWLLTSGDSSAAPAVSPARPRPPSAARREPATTPPHARRER